MKTSAPRVDGASAIPNLLSGRGPVLGQPCGLLRAHRESPGRADDVDRRSANSVASFTQLLIATPR